MNKLNELYNYAKDNNSKLSHLILDIIKNSSNKDSIIEDGGESILVDLGELQSLVDPDMVSIDLKIDSVHLKE